MNLNPEKLNRTLLSLVKSAQFSAAERHRLKITTNGFQVSPRPEYATVALAALRNLQLTGASGFKMEEYMTWLDLVPDRERLIQKRDTSQYPFNPIIQELTYRGLISNFRPFLSNTGLVVASKGYAGHYFISIARPIIISAPMSSPCIDHLVEMENLAAKYQVERSLPGTEIARFIRGSLIQLFSQRGWHWKSLDLLLKPRQYALNDIVYQTVLKGLPDTWQAQKRVQILKLWDSDKLLHMHGIKPRKRKRAT